MGKLLVEAYGTLQAVRQQLVKIVEFPKNTDVGMSEDGYPLEVTYDEFAYKRMVDAYRKAAQAIIDTIDTP